MKIAALAIILTFAFGSIIPCHAESAARESAKSRDFATALARARDNGKFSEALHISNEWIAAEPKNANAWLAQGYVLELMRADELAVQSYKRSTELNPNSFITWHSLGSAYLNLKQCEPAAAAFQEAVRLKPDDATARNNLGVARYCMDHM